MRRLFEQVSKLPRSQQEKIAAVIEAFVNQEAVNQLVSAGQISSSEFKWEDYPFTSAGRNQFIDHFNRAQEYSKPRDICDKLNDVAFAAAKTSKRLIDPDCLRAA